MDRPDDAAAGDQGAEECADEDQRKGGSTRNHHGRGRGGEGGCAGGGQRIAGIGAVDLDRIGHCLLAIERLAECGRDRRRIGRVLLGDIDHGADRGEIAVEGGADGAELLGFVGIGRRLDFWQAGEHFAGALVGLGAEILRLGGCRRQLVGHAADGDDIDTQVHRLAGDLLTGADRGHGALQALKAACRHAGDDDGRQAHDRDDQANLLRNGNVFEHQNLPPALPDRGSGASSRDPEPGKFVLRFKKTYQDTDADALILS